MKPIICPHCGKKTARTIGIHARAYMVYSLNREGIGYVSPQGNIWDGIWKYRRPEFIAFVCKYCSKSFPDRMVPEIRSYLKSDHLLSIIKGNKN